MLMRIRVWRARRKDREAGQLMALADVTPEDTADVLRAEESLEHSNAALPPWRLDRPIGLGRPKTKQPRQ
jgi:hypothetical protein